MEGTALGWREWAVAACIIAVLVVAGCRVPTPTATSIPLETPSPTPPSPPTTPPTPSQTPTNTPDPTPTSSPTPTPSPSPTPTATSLPTATPTPTPPPTTNLTPVTPRDWESALSFTNDADRRGGDTASLEQKVYISWAVRNTGPSNLDQPFATHLYLDGVFLNSWRSEKRVYAGSHIYDDWEGVADNVRLVPGEHRLTLWIDPYDEINEIDEDDNVLDMEIVVTGDPPQSTGTRLPDLAPRAREGWEAPLVVNSWGKQQLNGPLSVDAPTFISFAASNAGMSSVLDGVTAHLYVDDVYLEGWRWGYVLAEDAFYLGAWDGLLPTMRLAPGEHEVRVVLDPGDFVRESDEANNELAASYTWSTGAVEPEPPTEPPPVASPPSPVSQPDLVPYWQFKADGPIVVSNTAGTRAGDPTVAGSTVYIDLAVHNQSRFEVGPFAIDLFLDGNLVSTLSSGGLGASGVRELLDQPLFLDLTPGEHTLRMVIDSGDRIAEDDELDNVHKHTFVVYGSPPPPPQRTTFSEQEIASLLDALPDALDDRRPVLGQGASGLDGYALQVADLGYYLMTGTSTRDENLLILMLDDAGYREWIDENYADDFATSPTAEHEALLARRERLKDINPAFKTRDKGVVTIVVNAESSFADVLSSLAHELGHAKQDFDRPSQTIGASTHQLDGIHEAQAQQFERAFWLTLESRLGAPLLAYPEHPAFTAYVDSLFNTRVTDHAVEEHALGYLVQWLAVLADPNLVALKDELASEGKLGAEGSLELFDYFLSIEPNDAPAYVDGLLNELATWLPTILETARARPAPGLSPDLEGAPDLRNVALTSP